MSQEANVLIEVSGDILLSRAHAIAHGVAPGDHMDRGLALALRERWPALAKDFRHYCHVSHPRSGSTWSWKSSDGLYIINLLTQEAAPSEKQPPGSAHLEHVNHALRELRRFVEHEHIKSLALPRLATGVGGLKWQSVQPLLSQHLGELTIPIFLYTTYHPQQLADEQGKDGAWAKSLRPPQA